MSEPGVGEPGAAEKVVVLVDDTRVFRDGRAAHVARTAPEAIRLLTQLAEERIDELWLDYDLLDGTSEPVVEHLVARAVGGEPARIGQLHVHSARTLEAVRITTRLREAGYPARRNYAAGIWARNLAPLPV